MIRKLFAVVFAVLFAVTFVSPAHAATGSQYALEAEAVNLSQTYSGEHFYIPGGKVYVDLSPKVKSGTPVQSYFGMQLWNEQGTKVWDVPVSNVYDSVPLASPTLPAGNYYIRFTKPADGAVINMIYVISLTGYTVSEPTNTDLDAEALDWSTSYTGDVFYHNGGPLVIDSRNRIISGTPVQSYYTLKVFNRDTGALVWSINFDNQFNGDYVTSPSLPAGNYYIYLTKPNDGATLNTLVGVVASNY